MKLTKLFFSLAVCAATLFVSCAPKQASDPIPADKKEYIFERFTKLDSFVQGTGLGLSVARMIAERLGGSLTLDTDYTNGAKFDFIIPIT